MNNVHGIDERYIDELESLIRNTRVFVRFLKTGMVKGSEFKNRKNSINEQLYTYGRIGNDIQQVVDNIFKEYGTTEIKFESDDNLSNTTSTD